MSTPTLRPSPSGTEAPRRDLYTFADMRVVLMTSSYFRQTDRGQTWITLTKRLHSVSSTLTTWAADRRRCLPSLVLSSVALSVLTVVVKSPPSRTPTGSCTSTHLHSPPRTRARARTRTRTPTHRPKGKQCCIWSGRCRWSDLPVTSSAFQLNMLSRTLLGCAVVLPSVTDETYC